MQEKYLTMFAVRTGISIPLEPAYGRNPLGRIFRSEPQHMTDTISLKSRTDVTYS
jgi:hypothetical protein